MADRFSTRLGLGAVEPPITITHDAPHELRGILVDLAEEAGMDPSSMRSVVCTTLRVREEASNWSPYPNIDNEVRWHLDNCKWYQVYDIIEAVYRALVRRERDNLRGREAKPAVFVTEINQYLRREGIGWQLVDGEVRVRGDNAFEAIVSSAVDGLAGNDQVTASNELKEALNDLSRRPEADLTGAVQHALAALECVAREVCGDPRATLGAILSKHKGLIPQPLDQAVDRIWGFASERGRHLREGRPPLPADATLTVHVAAAVVVYLLAKEESKN